LKVWVALIAGMVSPYLLTSVISAGWSLLLALTGLLLLVLPRLRVFSLLPFCFLYTSFALHHRLAQRLPPEQAGTIRVLTGTVAALPLYRDELVSFDFLPDRDGTGLPRRIRVYWYADRTRPAARAAERLPVLHARERWQLQLELRTTRGRVNFNGSDSERRLLAQGVGALATVRAGPNRRLAGPGSLELQHWRESLLEALEREGAGLPALRILRALAVADRRGLLRSDRTTLAATGTGHLLAISGLHIGLAAAMGFYGGRLLLWLLPPGLKSRAAVAMPWVVCWLAALAYAAMAGFGVSTQRALIMLGVTTLVVVGRRNVSRLLSWLIALAAVLVLDPFAPLRAGFWFSFTAVGVLLFLFSPRLDQRPAWRRMLLAQAGISLAMSPLGMFWFHQASLPGLAANLVAIPLVSFVVVPLLLTALLLMPLPGPLAHWLLAAAAYSASGLMRFLGALASLQPESMMSTRTPGLLSTLLALAGALLLLMPRGLSVRLAGAALMLPLLLPAAGRLAAGEIRLDVLDVGQGLSVLLAAPGHLLVYDTGPGNGLGGEAGWNMVDSVIRPMITASGERPGVIIASHGDLDHAGGLRRLRQIYPGARYMANLRTQPAAVPPCRAPAHWAWGRVRFEVLHPAPGLPYLGNDSSCVVSVRTVGSSFLLSGDVSRAVENRLVDAGLRPHRLLLVPHHGSSTSSSQDFIDRVQPELALISAAPDNRFGLPRETVLRRYAKRHVVILNSADCGGVRVTGNVSGGLRVRTARSARPAVWRWPAAPDCP